AALESAKTVINESSVTINFDAKMTELYKKASSKESRQAIAEATRTAFGRELKVAVNLAGSPGAAEGDSEANDEEKLRKKAESDPTVQLFVKTFKGELTKV